MIRPGGALPGRRRVTLAAAVATAALCLFTVWVGFSLGGALTRRTVDAVATVLAAAAATTCCVGAARNLQQEGHFWTLLAAAVGAWTLGEAAWGWYDLVIGGTVPVPSYADIGYLGAIPLAVAALLCHPARQLRRAERVVAALDGLVLATSLLFLSWSFALGPVWHRNSLGDLGGVVAIAYPFGDIVIVFLLVRLLRGLDDRARLGVGWVLAGLLAMSMSDSVYTYASVVRGYESGSFVDVGWFAGYVAIALGALVRQQPASVRTRDVGAAQDALTALIPYLPPLTALSIIGVREQLGTATDATSVVLAVAVTTLVLVRQAVSGVRGSRGRLVRP